MSCYHCKSKNPIIEEHELYHGGKMNFHKNCFNYYKNTFFTESLSFYIRNKKINIDNYESEIINIIKDFEVMPFFKLNDSKAKHGYLTYLSIIVMRNFLEPEIINTDPHNRALKYRINLKYCNRETIISLKELQNQIITIIEEKYNNL